MLQARPNDLISQEVISLVKYRLSSFGNATETQIKQIRTFVRDFYLGVPYLALLTGHHNPLLEAGRERAVLEPINDDECIQ